MTETKRFSPLFALLSGFIFSAGGSASWAADEVAILEEVVVTATRRVQTVSQVPLAITAFTGTQLQARGIGDVQDLARVSSSLVITTSTTESAGTEVRIRGIGTSGNNPGLEPSVGIFVDNVYRSRSGLAAGDLLDIASVEILRGPQGTLFGRNTSAGTININTLKPEFEWGGYGEATVQNYNGYRIATGVTGPLVGDTLAFRLAASYNDRDGYVSDRLVSSRELYDRNRANVLGQLLWRAGDDVDVRLIVDYKHKDEHCCAADYTIAGPTSAAIEALGGIVKTDPFAYKAQQTFDSQDELDEWGVSAETNWAIAEDLSLTWIGAYRDADVFGNVDPDTSNLDLVKGTEWSQNNHFMSQEVRLNGLWGRVDWLVGAYYYTDDIDVDWQLLYGADFGPYFNLLLGVPAALFPEGVGDQSRYFKQDGEGWALFTHNVFELTDRYDLVVGFRWSDDQKDATARVVNDAVHCALIPFVPYCPVPDIQESRGEDEPSGTIKLVRNLDIGNIYLGYSRGYKAGGFNLDRDAATTGFEFEPETVDSYEAGLKWSLPDRTLEANTAIFYSEFQNYQINEFDGVSFATTNAAQVNSSGFEVELSWLPLTGLLFDAGLTWSNTQYDEHPVSNKLGNTLEGKRVPFAPEWAATGSISYQTPIGRFTGFGVINASYMGEHNTNETLEKEAEVEAFTIVNARLGVRTADANWEFSLWGKNVFEKDYNVIVFNTVLQDGSWSGFRGEPRMYGASVRYDF